LPQAGLLGFDGFEGCGLVGAGGGGGLMVGPNPTVPAEACAGMRAKARITAIVNHELTRVIAISSL
jgi:hypothetical protein